MIHQPIDQRLDRRRANRLLVCVRNTVRNNFLLKVLSQSLFLMNLESCRSWNLWSQFFDFARKTQLCDRTPGAMWIVMADPSSRLTTPALMSAPSKCGAGWRVYRQYSKDRSLYALESEARAARRGLWADSQPAPPWEWRIMATGQAPMV